MGFAEYFALLRTPIHQNMPEQYLPQSLKGADLVVYTALNSFGIQVDVLSVMIEDQHESDDSDDSEDQGCRHRKGRSFIHRNVSGKVHVGAELWSHRCSQNYCEDPVSTGVQLRFSLLRMKQNASSIKSRCFADFIDQVIQQEWPEKQDDK